MKKLFCLIFALCFLHSNNIDVVRFALEKEIRANYPKIIIINTQIKPGALPRNFEAYEFLRLGEAKFQRANGFFRAEFKAPNNTSKNIFFNYFIKANLEVLRANKSIQRGEKLNNDDFKIVVSDFSKVPPNALNLEDTRDLIAKTNIRKNAILKENMFKTDTLIKKNDKVIGILSSDGVDISLELVALSGGQKDDKIKLKSKDGRVLQGVIIDSNKVLLQ